jgi:hypothetical protein
VALAVGRRRVDQRDAAVERGADRRDRALVVRPPHIQPPIAHVPSPMRDGESVVPVS